MSNLNTIENVLPLVKCIISNAHEYTGYDLKYGYFEHASFDEDKSKLTIFYDNGDRIISWSLLNPTDRSDLMSRNFIWYDIVPSENLAKPSWFEEFK